MSKHRHTLTGTAAGTSPYVPPLIGGKLATTVAVKSVFRGQDSALVNGRRLLAAQSLVGGEFSFPDAGEDTLDQEHHSADVERPVLHARAHVTPGHFLKLSVLALPSGQTQFLGEVWDLGGSQGSIIVETTWTDRDGSTETAEVEVPLANSTEEEGALPSGSGALWRAIRKYSVNIIAPPDYSLTDELHRWSQHCAVDITVKHKGGARVVDCVLHEQPYGLALDDTDDAGQWVSGLYGNGAPDGAGAEFTHPLQRKSETGPDPRAGTWIMMDVAHAQANRLGPVLLAWTAWDESTAEVDGTTLPTITTGSQTFVSLLDDSQTSYDAEARGWSFSCGAYARRWAANHPLAMRDRDGSIPVRVWVWGSMPAGGTGTLRFQTAPWSWIDVTITGATPGWHSSYGHLRVGLGPGDPVVAQVFGKVDDFDLSVSAGSIVVEYAGDWESAV